MSKSVLFVSVLLFMAVPAMAATTVTLTCTSDGNEVTVRYASSSDVNLVRAFGLDVNTADANINVVEANALSYYRIYPGQIDIIDGEVDDYGEPYASGDLRDKKVTIEMGSLYTTDSNYQSDPDAGYNMKPARAGILLKFKVGGNCRYKVDVNDLRGGIVMEDPYETPSITRPLCQGTVVVGCIVPDVVGMTQADANAAIIAAQLVVGTITKQHSDTVPAGEVISQDPTDGGTVVNCGSAVDITVSLGPCVVPNVVNTAEAAAKTAITAAGFVNGNRTTACSDTIGAGKVISTTPGAGATPGCGTAVDREISTGPCTCACLGDINRDNQKSNTDYNMLKARLNQAYVLTNVYEVIKGDEVTGQLYDICADMNADGKINNTDYNQLKGKLNVCYVNTGQYVCTCP
jgi:hypothetical protein